MAPNVLQQGTGLKYSQGFSFIRAHTLRQGIYLGLDQIIVVTYILYFLPNKRQSLHLVFVEIYELGTVLLMKLIAPNYNYQLISTLQQ